MENINRRKFVKDSLRITAATAIGTSILTESNEALAHPMALTFSQIPLPYAYNALEPHIDAMTMEIHYNKHHAAYIKNVNDAIAAENIMASTEKDFFGSISKFSAKALITSPPIS